MSHPAWLDVEGWLRAGMLPLEILPADLDRRDAVLKDVGVSLGSALGSIIHETGGLLVDYGWIRILGSGHVRLPRTARVEPPLVHVADDAVGGFFALLPPEGSVGYLAPDTLEWEDLEMKYSAWLRWCLTDQVATFYQDYRAPDWQDRVRTLGPDQGFMIYPFPWAKEGGPIPERSWKPVPVSELYGMALEMRRQMGIS